MDGRTHIHTLAQSHTHKPKHSQPPALASSHVVLLTREHNRKELNVLTGRSNRRHYSIITSSGGRQPWRCWRQEPSTWSPWSLITSLWSRLWMPLRWPSPARGLRSSLTARRNPTEEFRSLCARVIFTFFIALVNGIWLFCYCYMFVSGIYCLCPDFVCGCLLR